MSKMAKLQKYVAKTRVTEFAIFKHFGIAEYGFLIVFWIVFFLIFSGTNWIFGKKYLSIQDSIMAGALAGFVFHLPSFVSALIMDIIKKPILRFDSQGFFYTPQIWSTSRLCEWESIQEIKIKRSRDSENGYKCTISIYLFGGRCVSLNEKIIPITYNRLMKLFRLRLPNIPIKVLK